MSSSCKLHPYMKQQSLDFYIIERRRLSLPSLQNISSVTHVSVIFSIPIVISKRVQRTSHFLYNSLLYLCHESVSFWRRWMKLISAFLNDSLMFYEHFFNAFKFIIYVIENDPIGIKTFVTNLCNIIHFIISQYSYFIFNNKHLSMFWHLNKSLNNEYFAWFFRFLIYYIFIYFLFIFRKIEVYRIFSRFGNFFKLTFLRLFIQIRNNTFSNNNLLDPITVIGSEELLFKKKAIINIRISNTMSISIMYFQTFVFWNVQMYWISEGVWKAFETRLKD